MPDEGSVSRRSIMVAQVAATRRAGTLALLRGQVASASFLEAGSSDEVVAALESRPIDLLVADELILGRGDASLLTWIRGQREHHDLPVLVVLESYELSLVEGSRELGADDFLVAPLRGAELVARVELLLRRRDEAGRRADRASELANLHQRQTEFLSVVSHEIRTPLSAIMSAASILMRYGRQKPESVERFAPVIYQECRRLTRLINNLLDLTKIEAGEVDWRFSDVAPDELLHQLKESFSALVGERSVNLAVTLAPTVGSIYVDSDKIIQVLVNLVSNAVRYAPEGSTVQLRCLPAAGRGVRFEVEDEGPGIPVGAEVRIFERFQQLDVSDERTGTGLGLAITKHIVEHHHGRIFAVPDRARGALLVVELPARGE